MKKKPKVIELDRFAGVKCYSDGLPLIRWICGRFSSEKLNSEWNIYWKGLNTDNKVYMYSYFNDNDFCNCTDFEATIPYVYLLRVMVLLDFCEVYGYELEDIKYE